MRVTRRLVSPKRHTVGFVVNNNKRVTRGQAVKLARSGKLDGLTAKRGQSGWYVSTMPGQNESTLLDLPEVVVQD